MLKEKEKKRRRRRRKKQELSKRQFLFYQTEDKKEKIITNMTSFFLCVHLLSSISLMIRVVYVCVRCHSPIYHEIKLF
jgi:hypothetical protein